MKQEDDDDKPLSDKMLTLLINTSRLIPEAGHALFAVWDTEEAMLEWSRTKPGSLRVAKTEVDKLEGILVMPPVENIPRADLAILGVAYAVKDSPDISPQTVLFCSMTKTVKPE